MYVMNSDCLSQGVFGLLHVPGVAVMWCGEETHQVIHGPFC